MPETKTDIDDLIRKLEKRCPPPIEFQKAKNGSYRIRLPVYHQDGDMVDIFLTPIQGEKHRVCLTDFGLTYMKLTCSCEAITPEGENLLDKIILQNGIREEKGQLFLESDIEQIESSLVKFSECQLTMLGNKNTIRS